MFEGAGKIFCMYDGRANYVIIRLQIVLAVI
jgi:hypothetical protein